MAKLVGKQVGPIGLGLMNLTWRSTPPPQEQAFATLRAAIANGCYCWNGADFYGTPDYNSLVLLERYFEKYPEDADKVVLSIKGGLKGRKKIDMFEFARRDPNVPLEVTFGVIDKEYVQTGKIGGIALSEVRAETIHEAVKYTKIVAVEAELSMYDNGVTAACAQYGISIVAYRPSAALASKVEETAARKGCTPAQLAINWTIALSRRLKTTIVPIPGSSTPERVEENSKFVEVSDEELDQIDAILKDFTPAGERYPTIFQTET
ncbi:NADP-dependent oxidoreductase domain-containing protein [Aspergillus desertorum]